MHSPRSTGPADAAAGFSSSRAAGDHHTILTESIPFKSYSCSRPLLGKVANTLHLDEKSIYVSAKSLHKAASLLLRLHLTKTGDARHSKESPCSWLSAAAGL